jgi:hypothetical protein
MHNEPIDSIIITREFRWAPCSPIDIFFDIECAFVPSCVFVVISVPASHDTFHVFFGVKSLFVGVDPRARVNRVF